MDRLPPHSLQAEQGVLGAIILDPANGLDTCADLAPSGFYDLRHRELFQILRAMHEARAPIDLVTISQKLADAGKLEAVGGIAYVSGLVDAVPSPANLAYYLGIVREKHTLRRVLQTAHDTIARVHDDPENVAGIVEQFERDALAIRSQDGADERSIKDDVHRLVTELTAAENGAPVPRIMTGFRALDTSCQGMRAGELFVIGARPGLGKTSLALNIAEHVAVDTGRPVGILSMEMDRQELVTRLVMSRARVDSRKAEAGKLGADEKGRLVTAMGRIAKAPIQIDDRPGLTIGQIAARARRWKQRDGIELLVIDYLGLIRDSGRARSRYEAVSDASRECKCLAKELSVPLILLAQLNRANDLHDRAPRLSDLRDSGSIEQDADFVWLLHDEWTDPEGETVEGVHTIGTAKARRGPRGVAPLRFIGEFTRFEDYDPERPAIPPDSLKDHP